MNEYYKDYAQGQIGSRNAPIFQVAANPFVVTGWNTELIRPDILPEGGNMPVLYAERPACVTVNKPTRFYDESGGFDTDQPRAG
jgi:hypothetical protein